MLMLVRNCASYSWCANSRFISVGFLMESLSESEITFNFFSTKPALVAGVKLAKSIVTQTSILSLLFSKNFHFLYKN